MRPWHRLGAAQMRVAGHDGVRIFSGHARESSHQVDQQFQIDVDLLAQPQPHVERYLLVAAAAGVNFVGQSADFALQFADDESVDVFVGSALEKLWIARLASGCSRKRSPIDRVRRQSGCPARSSARAKACEPRQSQSSSFLSKWSEPEKRSKTSEGPPSNRPPQSFISATS